MKKLRLLFSGLIVIVLVGSALSFKPYSDGSVYCSSNCALSSVVQYKVDPEGTANMPCGINGAYVQAGPGICILLPLHTKFSFVNALSK